MTQNKVIFQQNKILILFHLDADFISEKIALHLDKTLTKNLNEVQIQSRHA